MPVTSESVRAEIGVIGGSGLYDLDELADSRQIRVVTPYGDPSDALVIGTLFGRTVAFLPRHGREHRIAPSQVPARANIYALKSLGVRQVVSVSAVGSLREDFAPGDLVIPDQIVDRTHGVRASTFFDDSIVVHVPFADPYCGRLRGLLATAAGGSTSARTHDTGTYCCMEGPQFSTRAESELYRAWGLDIIGMTALPEAKLAREAELCYAGLALVTDYDCWRAEDGFADVSATAVADVMRRNNASAAAAIAGLMHDLPAAADCACHDALADAIITPVDTIPEAVRQRRQLLLGKYLAPEVRVARPMADVRPL
jgi:5'-methylthioadenosine phosphorylase